MSRLARGRAAISHTVAKLCGAGTDAMRYEIFEVMEERIDGVIRVALGFSNHIAFRKTTAPACGFPE